MPPLYTADLSIASRRAHLRPAWGIRLTRAGPGDTTGTDADGSGTQLLLLCGPAGVGKSTIGFQLYQRCVRAGLTAGYIDLDQIGFLRPRPAGDPRSHRLKARNLAAIWRTYHAAGATHLVLSGPIQDQASSAVPHHAT
jgi:hypothetical protein